MAAVTAEVRVYSAEYCDKTYAKKGEAPGAGGGGTPSNLLVLGPDDPVPAGTKVGTIIVRRAR